MDNVFRGALTDPALFHALSLVLSLAANSNVPNAKTLVHRGKLLKAMRTAMARSTWTPEVSTMSAMLILVGYEYRIDGGDGASIALHLRAMQTMMDLLQAEAEKVELIKQVQRAMFWQDLLSCLIVGTPRLLSHQDYEEWRHPEHLGRPHRLAAPRGFASILNTSPAEFALILQDLRLLCATHDGCVAKSGKAPPLDNSQANLESRLVNLLCESRNTASCANPLYEACIFAAYLCTYKLSVGIWNGSFVPELCVDRLLSRLMDAVHDRRCASSPSLVLWLLFVVGGLTERQSKKIHVKLLLETVFSAQLSLLHQEWGTLKTCLENFIWSEHMMETKIKCFWEQMHPKNLAHLR
ncbi:N-ethylmaleimide reductase [Pyrenophora seminiperda CCB06]|uniref:N-ethylmaleimide reductase n=1 Tax=Pyrenophora seminiperda CCB06 TaxID=1302712 RepID=A0A3M7MBC9_9PLEO|nr:N-ethylmaleimide reductase [Pyrenophora seminiperda CCB06]